MSGTLESVARDVFLPPKEGGVHVHVLLSRSVGFRT